MIILTTIIDETEQHLSSEGIITTLQDVTPREIQMANGLLEAIESYCTEKRGVEGAVFLRRDLPEANEGQDELPGQ